LSSWKSATGWARHSIFGLRKEWLELYFAHPRDWTNSPSLGNKQVDSLRSWLRTTGIENRLSQQSPSGQEFAFGGIDCLPLWELLWVNVVFSFPTARWYVHLGCGEWTTSELKSLLHLDVPRLAARTVSNAVTELAGLLERSPVGELLDQGIVVADRRGRRIRRLGWEPSERAVLHCLRCLFVERGVTTLHWDRDLTWPWVVFGCTREFVLGRLIGSEQTFFQITEEGVTDLKEVTGGERVEV